MTILPKLRTKYGEGIGVELFVQAPDLSENEATFLSTDADAADTTFTVENGNTFTANEYILFGSFGAATTSSIKTVTGIAKASVKTVNGIAIASVKSINGIT